jgi:hypothetical protein
MDNATIANDTNAGAAAAGGESDMSNATDESGGAEAGAGNETSN